MACFLLSALCSVHHLNLITLTAEANACPRGLDCLLLQSDLQTVITEAHKEPHAHTRNTHTSPLLMFLLTYLCLWRVPSSFLSLNHALFHERTRAHTPSRHVHTCTLTSSHTHTHTHTHTQKYILLCWSLTTLYRHHYLLQRPASLPDNGRLELLI
jgi:hypothetical protein